MLLEPPRSLRLRCSSRKSVNIYPRSSPVSNVRAFMFVFDYILTPLVKLKMKLIFCYIDMVKAFGGEGMYSL